MPSLFGKRQTLLPFQSRIPEGQRLVNPFGLRGNLADTSRIQIPTAQPGNQPPQDIDFVKEYAKLNQMRPNRLAYQEELQQGPEQIQRGKWAKLGAMLAAGGSALGGTAA